VFDISINNTDIRNKSDWKAVYEIKEEKVIASVLI